MTIVSSEIIEDRQQAHDQRYVWERHVDHLNRDYFFFYAAPLKADVEKIMIDRIPSIELVAKEKEISEVIGRIERGEPFELEYVTKEELKPVLEARMAEKEVEIINMTEQMNNISDEISKKIAIGEVE